MRDIFDPIDLQTTEILQFTSPSPSEDELSELEEESNTSVDEEFVPDQHENQQYDDMIMEEDEEDIEDSSAQESEPFEDTPMVEEPTNHRKAGTLSSRELRERTERLREKFSGHLLCDAIERVIEYMKSEGLDVPLFLDGLLWGDKVCIRSGKLRHARRVLTNSAELPLILRRLWKPPRMTKMVTGAQQVMEEFARQCSREVLDRQLERVAEYFKGSTKDDTKAETLTHVNFSKMIEQLKQVNSPPHCDMQWHSSTLATLAAFTNSLFRRALRNPSCFRIISGPTKIARNLLSSKFCR